MKPKRSTLFLAELRESVAMALQAITAHKLRSSLTLLGVLIGVFSIIVVMTALRVMQSDIETKLSQLGINCFMIQKRPGLMFSGADWERVARRNNPGQRPSMMQDVLQGRSLEVEVHLGQLQAFARETGVATPIIDILLPLVRALDHSPNKA